MQFSFFLRHQIVRNRINRKFPLHFWKLELQFLRLQPFPVFLDAILESTSLDRTLWRNAASRFCLSSLIVAPPVIQSEVVRGFHPSPLLSAIKIHAKLPQTNMIQSISRIPTTSSSSSDFSSSTLDFSSRLDIHFPLFLEYQGRYPMNPLFRHYPNRLPVLLLP